MKKFAVLFSLFAATSGFAQRPVVPPFSISEATSEIKIDGVLEEKAWTDAGVIPLLYEWTPGDNVAPPVKTDCLVTFDDDNLYIAFRSYDPDPSKIRAHIMDRDSIDTFIQDDHIGVMIDPFNDERRAVQMRVNPLGIQADAVFSDQDGIEDWSWDIIWNSAGKVNEHGYVVEIAIPFNQLRFPRTAAVQTWGFEAFRSWPRNVRHRISSRWTDRNASCVLCQENKIVGLQGITPGRNLEFDPTFTTDRTDRLNDFPDGDLESDGWDAEPGLTARWGLTPNLTLNGTLNPDFSQVEADVAQLDVNTRFALFFPEKRPFFLEGIDFFSTPLDAVFTRTVADPGFGVKLSGKEGRNNLGLFVTRDEVNNLIFPSNQFSSLDSVNQDVMGSVLRYRRDLGAASTLGFLYSGREAEQYHNRQIAFDGFHRFSASDSLIYQFLHSDTDYPDSVAVANDQPLDSFGGEAYFVRYNHFARNWSWWARYQDLAPEFRADSGFIPRVDVRTAEGSLARTFFSETGWFTRLDVGTRFLRTEDHEGLMTDREIVAFATYRGPWQSLLDAGVYTNKEYFNGVTFDIHRVDLFGQLRPRGSLAIDMFARIGDAVDFANTQIGDVVLLNPIVELKVGPRVNVRLDHTYQALDVPGGRLFTANLSQIKVLYHFNTRTFVRAILQYEQLDRTAELFSTPVDPETNQLFTQFLFSYKLNPQTVLFVGYSDNHLGLENTSLTQTDRTFFMKVGYALVF